MADHLFEAQLLAAFLGIPPGTIRRWACEGHILRRGTGRNRASLYDLTEVADYARSLRRARVDPRHARRLANA